MRAELVPPWVLRPPYPFELPLTKPFDPGLVLDLRFHEGVGGIARDLSQELHHGTIYGATWTGLGRHGHALDFDGTNDYVYCGNAGDLGTSYTFSGWFKTDTLVGEHIIIGQTGGTPVWGRISQTADDVRFWVRSNNGTEVEAIVYDVLNTSDWFFAVGVRISNDIYLYVNAGTPAHNSASFGSITTTGQRVGVGAFWTGSSWASFHNGIIDESRILRRALSAEEVKRRYELLAGG